MRWLDAYIADGATLHNVEVRYGCRTDYAVHRTGDALTVTVLREDGNPTLCDQNDVILRRAVFETAPFTRQP